MIRLDRYLSEGGKFTRREAGEAVRRGLVAVNGETVRDPSRKVDETADRITVEVRGTADGEFVVRDGRNGPVAARVRVAPSEAWKSYSAPLSIGKGRHALYFTYEGAGRADFRSFCFGT